MAPLDIIISRIPYKNYKDKRKETSVLYIKEPKGARLKREREKPTYSQCDAITNDVRDQKKKRKKKRIKS